MEYQFDHNTSFKWDVNLLTADDQRSQRMMQDNNGNVFWIMTDSKSEVTVYKEQADQKSWNVLAHDRRELAYLVHNLKLADTTRRKSERINVNIDVNLLLDEFRLGIGAVEHC